MANYRGHSHVRGAGYYAKLDRICQNGKCKHLESVHFGACTRCPCVSFAARRLSATERRIMADTAKKKDSEIKYTGEAWLNEFVSDMVKKTEEGDG